LYARENTNRPSGWIRINPSSGSSQSVTGTTGLATNTWTHIAVTYDGTTLRFFVNGTQVNSKSYSGNMYTTTSPLKIGGNAVWGEYFAGQIDEIRIYNRALTQSEITTNKDQPL